MLILNQSTRCTPLLSPGTEDEDLGETPAEADSPPTKWEVYEKILGIPYYVTFSRATNATRYFTLRQEVYHEVFLPRQGLWLPEAGLGVGPWVGTYEGLRRTWLRFYDAQGVWLPTPAEQAEHQAAQEGHRAEQAEHQAVQEGQRAERLAARLRALGLDPDA